MHGDGTFTWVSGARYTGEWVANKPQGKGTFVWPDGGRWEGRFIDGRQQGVGTYFVPDGTRFVAAWSEGTLVWPAVRITASRALTWGILPQLSAVAPAHTFLIPAVNPAG
jgi:hypothetical protein